MENKEETNYRNIFKALSLFGGVQIIVILFGILRTKIIALTVGPVGVGSIGLYLTAITLFFSVFNLGIGASAVKLLSENYFSDNKMQFTKSIFVLNRLTLITAIIGFVFMLSFAPFLSKWSFGNQEHTWSFVFLSTIILFESYNSRNLAILQGLRELKILGKVSIYGSVFGTVISIPLYILFRIDAIIPSIIIIYLSNFLLSYVYTKKLHLNTDSFTYSETKTFFKGYVTLGIAMTISSILVYVVSYFVKLYLSDKGGLKVVGLYQAGWAIVTGYVGLIFTAMSKDYYPRLASVNSDNLQVSKIANQQIEIGLLIISPIIMIFLLFVNQIVIILYSSEFLLIKNMMIWSLIGMFFKLLSWSISYIFLAKGLSKYFVIYEILGNVFTLIVSILGYKYFGLEGLGLGFLATNIFYLILVYYFSTSIFDFKFSNESIRFFVLNLFICILAVLFIRIDFFIVDCVKYCLLFVGLMIVFFNSIINLDKRLGIYKLIKSIFFK